MDDGPYSTISVVGNRVGFKYHQAGRKPHPSTPVAGGSVASLSTTSEEEFDPSRSAISLIRRKHLSHINALRDDGFDFIPPDAQDRLVTCANRKFTTNINANDIHDMPKPSQAPQPPKKDWRQRLLAGASTLKISGVGKKLKNKVILLRDALAPSWANPPPPPVYASAATPAAPAPFLNMPPPTKHEFVSQRIICIRDIAPALSEGEQPPYDFQQASPFVDAQSLMSPARTRKALSTLVEEEDEADDDEPMGDEYVSAVLMSVENLQDIPAIARTMGSPGRSRVSPPWMHKQLEQSSDTIKPPLPPRNSHQRPTTGSTIHSVLSSEPRPSVSIHSPSIRFDVDTNSLTMSISQDDDKYSSLNSRHLGPPRSPSFTSGRKERPASIVSFTSTESSYGANARRRSSSLVMLPLPRSSSGSVRARGTTVSGAFGGRDKENEHSGYGVGAATFGRATGRQVLEPEDDEDEDDEDDEDDGEQEYLPVEALMEPDEKTGKRESVIVLVPVPKNEADRESLFKSRWSSTHGTERDSVITNPFLTPAIPQGKPLPPTPSRLSSISSFRTASESEFMPDMDEKRSATPQPPSRPPTIPEERSPPPLPPRTIPPQPARAPPSPPPKVPIATSRAHTPNFPPASMPFPPSPPTQQPIPRIELRHPAPTRPLPQRPIMPIAEFERLQEEANPEATAPPPYHKRTLSTSVLETPTLRKTPRPLTPLNWESSTPVPDPAPSPSFPAAIPLAPPKTKSRSNSIVPPRKNSISSAAVTDFAPRKLSRTKTASPALGKQANRQSGGSASGGVRTPRQRSRSISGTTFGLNSPTPPRQKSRTRTPLPAVAPAVDRTDPPAGRRRTGSKAAKIPPAPSGAPPTPSPTIGRRTPRSQAVPVDNRSPTPSATRVKSRLSEVVTPSPSPPSPRVTKQTNEFMKSSGKAFAGQNFKSIEVVEVDSGEREVFMETPKMDNRRSLRSSNAGAYASGSSTPSSSTPTLPSQSPRPTNRVAYRPSF